MEYSLIDPKNAMYIILSKTYLQFYFVSKGSICKARHVITTDGNENVGQDVTEYIFFK